MCCRTSLSWVVGDIGITATVNTNNHRETK
jgi:hypothetical protein